MDRFLRIAVVISLFVAVPLPASRGASNPCPQPNETPLTLSLDGVALEGCLPFSPAAAWVQPDPAKPVQVAYTRGAGRGFTITAIPFGSAAPTEVFPRVDASSSEPGLREILRRARQDQGARVETGPAAQLFGRPVESLVSTLALPGSDLAPQSTRLTEWLLLAGQRLWIFRASQPVSLLGAPVAAGLSLTSANLNAPSTSAAALRRLLPGPASIPSPLSPQAEEIYDLPAPDWWSGECDNHNYQWDSYLNPYRIPSYPLGTSFRGVPACGPLPGLGYPDVMAYFYPGAFPVLEWECVELVLRFMNQAYGVPPYAANGNYIVYSYAGSMMEKVSNGVSGRPPVPGDVLSYCAGCTYGHTSVVIASNINSSGYGSIVVMEQNWSAGGQTTLPVRNWAVIGDAGWVYGWLHPKYIREATPTPTPTCIPTSVPTAALEPTPATPQPNQMYFPSVSNAVDPPCG